jgi:hypothetical protein
MHWDLASATVSASNEAETFHFNACLREGAATSELKKVTCKSCKPLTEFPRTPLQAANLLWTRMRAHHVQDPKSQTFSFVITECNTCTHEMGLNELSYVPEHQAVNMLMNFLNHCAYEHGGSEPIIRVDFDGINNFPLALAMGLPARTDAEVKWRKSLEVV